MRRYNIVVSGILLIFSINGFALAAPISVQEKHQAGVDALHIPKDVITVLGKRGDEELARLLDQYFKAIGKPAESSDAHVLSSLAPPGSDHGPTNVVQEPLLNLASSTANPYPYHPLMEISGPSSTAPMQGDEVHGIPHALASIEYHSDHELMAANAFFKSWKPLIIESSSEIRQSSEIRPSSNVAPETPSRDMLEELFKTWRPHTLESSEVHASSSSALNLASSSANPDPLVMVEPSSPSAATQVQDDDELNGPLHILASAAAEYGSDSDFDWEQTSIGNRKFRGPKAAGPAPPKRLIYENQEHVQQPNPRPSTEPEVVNLPSPSLASPKDSDSGFEDEGVVQRSPVVMLI